MGLFDAARFPPLFQFVTAPTQTVTKFPRLVIVQKRAPGNLSP